MQVKMSTVMNKGKDVKSTFAHMFGNGSLDYHPGGKVLATGGSDCLVRVFQQDIEKKPKEVSQANQMR